MVYTVLLYLFIYYFEYFVFLVLYFDFSTFAYTDTHFNLCNYLCERTTFWTVTTVYYVNRYIKLDTF